MSRVGRRNAQTKWPERPHWKLRLGRKDHRNPEGTGFVRKVALAAAGFSAAAGLGVVTGPIAPVSPGGLVSNAISDPVTNQLNELTPQARTALIAAYGELRDATNETLAEMAPGEVLLESPDQLTAETVASLTRVRDQINTQIDVAAAGLSGDLTGHLQTVLEGIELPKEQVAQIIHDLANNSGADAKAAINTQFDGLVKQVAAQGDLTNEQIELLIPSQLDELVTLRAQGKTDEFVKVATDALNGARKQALDTVDSTIANLEGQGIDAVNQLLSDSVLASLIPEDQLNRAIEDLATDGGARLKTLVTKTFDAVIEQVGPMFNAVIDYANDTIKQMKGNFVGQLPRDPPPELVARAEQLDREIHDINDKAGDVTGNIAGGLLDMIGLATLLSWLAYRGVVKRVKPDPDLVPTQLPIQKAYETFIQGAITNAMREPMAAIVKKGGVSEKHEDKLREALRTEFERAVHNLDQVSDMGLMPKLPPELTQQIVDGTMEHANCVIENAIGTLKGIEEMRKGDKIDKHQARALSEQFVSEVTQRVGGMAQMFTIQLEKGLEAAGMCPTAPQAEASDKIVVPWS
ncbi:MAG: hypothetical protein IPJ65_06040 [Archangiaceae bacterium]|nr:hypothetical protein [Archangiaceae bacterium]